jgi:hypothetical protein
VFRELFAEFGKLFSNRSSRTQVTGLILVLALVPLLEMLAIRLFSGIITQPELFTEDSGRLALQIAGFFAALAATRGAHHAVRIIRPRVFQRAFAQMPRQRTRQQESWEFAQAFEISGVLAGLVQAGSFVAVITVFDVPTGLVSGVVALVVLSLMARRYDEQTALQAEYIRAAHTENAVGVPSQVHTRVRAAEMGSITATVGLALALGFLLHRVLNGGVDTADAIMMFLGLRLMFGQLGNVSSSAMRFARATARVNV